MSSHLSLFRSALVIALLAGSAGALRAQATCTPDRTAPSITSVTVSPNTLWSPNHKFVAVALSAITTDNCSPAPTCSIGSITSNEPVNGLGDGDTEPDWQLTGALTANLRAERSGTGTGRVYTLAISCRDAAGNVTNGSATVTVPHDQRKGSAGGKTENDKHGTDVDKAHRRGKDKDKDKAPKSKSPASKP